MPRSYQSARENSKCRGCFLEIISGGESLRCRGTKSQAVLSVLTAGARVRDSRVSQSHQGKRNDGNVTLGVFRMEVRSEGSRRVPGRPPRASPARPNWPGPFRASRSVAHSPDTAREM